MSLSVRPLSATDADTSRRLGWEAFGVPRTPPDQPAALDQPGMHWFGAFEQDRLAARMVDREYDSWFGGALLATSGIAGVTVAAEARGRGALTPLFAETLAAARRRGAVLSTLFPTAPRIYRRFGYELVADLVTVELRTATLELVAPPASTTTRRAGVTDVPAIRAVYHRWARAQNGPLSRRGVSFGATDEELLADTTAVSVAVDGRGDVVGYACWDRGQGYGEGSALEVTDLHADTGDGLRALLRLVGSFSSVAPDTRIETSGDDLARLLVPSLPWRVTSCSPYMLKVLDVPGALAPRRYPRSVTTELVFTLEGDALPGLDGSYRLAVSGGRAECGPTDRSDRVLTPRGLALLYAGRQSCANLRAAGLLQGGDPEEDLDWDALFGGRQAHIRDYF